eukprot:gene8162-12622_t
MTTWNDEEEATEIVLENGLMLKYLSPELQNKFKIVLMAVEENGLALKYASQNMQSNEKIVTKALLHSGMALQYASEEIKSNREIVGIADNREIVLIAVNQKGYAYDYISKRLQAEKGIACDAIKQDCFVYEMIPIQLKNDIDIGICIVQYYPNEYFSLSQSLRNNKEIMLQLVKSDEKMIKQIPSNLLNERNFVIKLATISLKNDLEVQMLVDGIYLDFCPSKKSLSKFLDLNFHFL